MIKKKIIKNNIKGRYNYLKKSEYRRNCITNLKYMSRDVVGLAIAGSIIIFF